MTHDYKLTLIMKDTGETASLSGRFADDEWDRLKEFAQYAEDLLTTKYVKDGMPASLTIHWDEQSGLAASSTLPPWDDVTVFLHKFRPLGLQSESTYFYKICGILSKELAHPYFRSMIDEQREIFSGKRMQAQFQIQSNDVVLNSEKVLNDWLNAYEYHRVKEKREFIDSLHAMIPLEASKALFLALLTDKAKAIYGIAGLIQVVLGNQKSIEGRVKRPN
jgi:hypothetical protein